jgi:uncharacterized protein
MLTIPMARLEREESLEIRSEIPSDDPSWEGTELRFSTPLSISGQAQYLASGDVLARLDVQGSLAQECRRCLEPVEVPVDQHMDLLFVPTDESEMGEGEETRPLPAAGAELDLTEAVREEIILAQSPFALCSPDCRGLCPQCGVNLNRESCRCSGGEPDPRWEALRSLKEKRE